MTHETRTPTTQHEHEQQAKRLLPEKEGGEEADGKGGKVRVKINKSTKTALCVDDLQQRLPRARVCYVSGTYIGIQAHETCSLPKWTGHWGMHA